MEVVLDSNIYLADLFMESNKFSNLFDFMRRTDSKLLLPALVRDEIVGKHKEKYEGQLRKVTEEIRKLKRYDLGDDVRFDWRVAHPKN